MNEDRRSWDLDVLQDIFNKRDMDLILKKFHCLRETDKIHGFRTLRQKGYLLSKAATNSYKENIVCHINNIGRKCGHLNYQVR